jgi:uncharacterized protein YecT (DUF1311 family)
MAPQSRAGFVAARLVILVFMLTATVVQCSAQDRCDIVPPGWHPSLKESLDFMEEEADARTQPSQQFLNRIGQSLADLRDAQLFIRYVSLMQVLDKPGRNALFEEQRDWLKQRREQAKEAVKSEGGSLQPLEYSSAFRRITEARLATLQNRLTGKCPTDTQK